MRCKGGVWRTAGRWGVGRGARGWRIRARGCLAEEETQEEMVGSPQGVCPAESGDCGMETGLKARARWFGTVCTQAGTFRGRRCDWRGRLEGLCCLDLPGGRGEGSYGAGLCHRRKKV